MFIVIGGLSINSERIKSIETYRGYVVIRMEDEEDQVIIECKEPETIFRYLNLLVKAKAIPIIKNVKSISYGTYYEKF